MPSAPLAAPGQPRALTVAAGLFFVGNGVLFPLAAYLIRDLPTYTASTWHLWLSTSLAIGLGLPVVVLFTTATIAIATRLRGKGASSPLALVVFAVIWSMPGLYSNHNAFADWRSGPTSVEKHVVKAEPLKVTFDGAQAHHYWDCSLTFADGSTRQLHRFSVEYLSDDRSDGDHGDPCHGLRAGATSTVVTLAHLDELVAIDPK